MTDSYIWVDFPVENGMVKIGQNDYAAKETLVSAFVEKFGLDSVRDNGDRISVKVKVDYGEGSVGIR